jgi:hypothetical protein
VRSGDSLLPARYFTLDFSKSLIWFEPSLLKELDSISLQVFFRVYPIAFEAPLFLRDRRLLEKASSTPGAAPYTERPAEKNASLFGLEGLTRSGSISRGLTIGSNQDAVVNSSLNLQLAVASVEISKYSPPLPMRIFRCRQRGIRSNCRNLIRSIFS